MIGNLDDYFRFHQNALSLRAERQKVLASNIANADTPNYKARDFDFTKALQNAMGSATPVQQGGIARTAQGHLAGNAPGKAIAGEPLQFRTVTQGSVDGNTVDMDVERNQFADNALRYEAVLTMTNSRIKGLLAAIQGQ